MFMCGPAFFSEPAGGAAAGHRYWRLNITANNGASWISINELILRTSPGGAQAATGGTSSASSTTAPESSARAFDGSNITQWSSATTGPPQWLKYDMGSGVTLDVVEFAVKSRSDGFPTAAPKDFVLQWSDDNSAWTDLITVTNQTGWSTSETRTFS